MHTCDDNDDDDGGGGGGSWAERSAFIAQYQCLLRIGVHKWIFCFVLI